jgi:hypothetical protein
MPSDDGLRFFYGFSPASDTNLSVNEANDHVVASL